MSTISREQQEREADTVGAIADMWTAVEPTFRDRVQVIEDVVADLVLERSPDRSAASDAAHKLAGTLGMFGMSIGSELALELEALLQNETNPCETNLDRMAEIANRLRRDLEARAKQHAAPAANPDRAEQRPSDSAWGFGDAETRVAVRLIGRDDAFHESLVWTCSDRGMVVDHVCGDSTTTPGLPHPAHVVIIDAGSVDDTEQMIRDAARGRTSVIVLADGDDFVGRISYRRAGAGTLVSPAAGAEQVTAIVERVAMSAASELTVLCLGLKPGNLNSFQDEFAQEQCRVELLTEPSALAATIERLAPDALIIGEDIDGVDQLDALAAINADPVWSSRLVVALTSTEASIAEVSPTALAHGADDVLSNERGWAAVAQRIRLRSEPLLSGDRSRFGSGGPRARLAARLDTLLTTALRSDAALSILYLHVKGLAELNRAEGYAAGDQRLSRAERLLAGHVRAGDCAGAWIGGGFVAALPLQRDAAIRRLHTLQAELEHTGAPCQGGVAVAGSDGTSIDQLIAVAQRRATDAVTDRDRWRRNEQGRVLVVEDDTVVSSLVRELLEAEGHQVEITGSGPSAADILSDPDVGERLDLVLLDITLPGLDGFGVLRVMQQANTLSQVPVLVLTAHVRKEEVQTALDLGAVDHVAKPFSPAVLLHRVQRAMGSGR